MMRALEFACRCLAALPYLLAAAVICALWALSVPVVWVMGRSKGGEK